MDQSRLDQIVKVLTEKGVKAPCPRCGHHHFTVVGDTLFPMQEDPDQFVIGGPSVPAVMAACGNCGFLTFHASVLLGLAKGAAK